MGTVTNLQQYKERKLEEQHQKEVEQLRALLSQHNFYDPDDIPLIFQPSTFDGIDMSQLISVEIKHENDNGENNLQDPDR